MLLVFCFALATRSLHFGLHPLAHMRTPIFISGSTHDPEMEEVAKMITKLCALWPSEFFFTSATVNDTYLTQEHTDQGNLPLMLCLTIGKFTQGGYLTKIPAMEKMNFPNMVKTYPAGIYSNML